MRGIRVVMLGSLLVVGMTLSGTKASAVSTRVALLPTTVTVNDKAAGGAVVGLCRSVACSIILDRDGKLLDESQVEKAWADQAEGELTAKLKKLGEKFEADIVLVAVTLKVKATGTPSGIKYASTGEARVWVYQTKTDILTTLRGEGSSDDKKYPKEYTHLLDVWSGDLVRVGPRIMSLQKAALVAVCRAFEGWPIAAAGARIAAKSG